MLRIPRVFTASWYYSSTSSVRVRFAPSPTGDLHLGGLRTAFYNYLFAKKNHGKFVLRIEDTDQKRVKAGSLNNITQILQWTGLIPDESPVFGGPYGPYTQSERIPIYQEHADHLLKVGAAYRCFCSETRLDLLRKESQRSNLSRGYDNKCRHLTQAEAGQLLSEGKKFTIRFKIPSGTVSFEDIIFGSRSCDMSEEGGDFIIVKSDGFPTYHFACVVDDRLMGISHVLRGAEWLLSTPKHILLHRSFGWHPPHFAHLPLLINSDRTKLSKRQESVGIQYFKGLGYTPEAVLNFLAVAGGGFGRPDGFAVHDLPTLASQFDLSAVHTNSCIIDVSRLDGFGQRHLEQRMGRPESSDALVRELRHVLREKYGSRYVAEEKNLPDEYLKRILLLYKGRIHTLLQLTEPTMEFLWTYCDPSEVSGKITELKIPSSVLRAVPLVTAALSSLPETSFTKEEVSPLLKELCTSSGTDYKPLMRALRTILTNQKDGPGVSEILEMLGKTRSLKKLSSYAAEA